MAIEHFTPGPMDRSFYDPEFTARGIILKKDETIKRLMGKDGEKDAEICKKIRENIMAAESPEGINQLTGALLNMMKVIAEKVDM